MAKNAYTFAKRSKELAKKKKKEDKQMRKSQRETVEEGPVYDEATGQIIYPQAQSADETDDDSEGETSSDEETAPGRTDQAAP